MTRRRTKPAARRIGIRGFALQSPPADCDDTNSTVWPGGREIPGNGIDDDCSGGDKAAKILSPVPYDWSATTPVALKPDGSASMGKLFKYAFPRGAVLEVWLTAPNSIGKVVRFEVQRGRNRTPRGRTMCLRPGAAKPGKC